MKLTSKQLQRILSWSRKNKLDPTMFIDIKVSNESGIGPSVRASAFITEDEGIFLDASEYDTW